MNFFNPSYGVECLQNNGLEISLSAFCLSSLGLDFVRPRVKEALQNLKFQDKIPFLIHNSGKDQG
jgi:hypothetical protein